MWLLVYQNWGKLRQCQGNNVLLSRHINTVSWSCKIYSGIHHTGCLWIFEAKKTSKKKIFIWWKLARGELSCDVVYLFIDLVIIEISFDLYLSIGIESIEAHTLTNNGKLFNKWITRKRSQRALFQHIFSWLFFHIFSGGLRLQLE